MNAILNHPVWPKIRPFVRVTGQAAVGTTKYHRLEIEGKIPHHLAAEALSAEIPCVACGTPVKFVRNRLAANDRHPFRAPFIGVACSNKVNSSCCRGNAAANAIREIAANVEATSGI